MAYDPDSALSKALDRLTLAQVAEGLGMPPLRSGVQKSPFREDRHGAAFSVFDNGKRFKDHGREDHEGGAWVFVALARPEWGKQQVAEFLIRLAGLDPKQDAKRSRADFRRTQKDQRRAMYRGRERALSETRDYDPLSPWQDCVRDRYEDGRGPGRRPGR